MSKRKNRNSYSITTGTATGDHLTYMINIPQECMHEFRILCYDGGLLKDKEVEIVAYCVKCLKFVRKTTEIEAVEGE